MTNFNRSSKDYDCCVIGGGFFGCSLAAYLAKRGNNVVLLEQGTDYLQRASYNNQARIHNGYHYPRHFLTAVRSRVNFPRFIEDFQDCVVSDFDKYYAIGSRFSKVTSVQFYNFMTRVGAPIEQAEAKISKLFNPELIEDVFRVREYAFHAGKLKAIALQRMQETNVEHRLNVRAKRIQRREDGKLHLSWSSSGDTGELIAKHVYNCTYSELNSVLNNSGIDLVPLKHEITEMCLIQMPQEFNNKSVTVMCGPFFSVMPFPAKGKNIHTLSHVRYTPHVHWYDRPGNLFRSPYEYFSQFEKKTRYLAMIKDAARYIPSLEQASHVDSLWEVKTTLPASEDNDGRPILFRRNCGLPGVTSILGGKIDNIYDVYKEIERDGE